MSISSGANVGFRANDAIAGANRWASAASMAENVSGAGQRLGGL
jgi:hypothetical protein